MKKEKIVALVMNGWQKLCRYFISFILVGLIGSIIINCNALVCQITDGKPSEAFIYCMSAFIIIGVLGMIGCIPHYVNTLKDLWHDKKYGALISNIFAGSSLSGMTVLWTVWCLSSLQFNLNFDFIANISLIGFFLFVGGVLLCGLSYIVRGFLVIIKPKLKN